MRCSRRHALRLIGASGVITATAGCLNPGSLDSYALIASEQDLSVIGRPYLWPDPTEINATTKVDFTAETKQQYTSELFNTGSVTVQQWPLVGRDRWGKDTRPRPTFLRRDGTFYRVQISEEQQLEQERWHFAVTRTEETPPDDATVERPPFDRSPQDKRILEAALDAVYAGNDGFLGEPQFENLQTVEYHHHLDAEVSELVPSPPFDYLEYEDEYFRPVTAQRTVTVPKWTYTIDEITNNRGEFQEYARTAILELDLSALDLSESARGVIDDAISEEPRRYEEGAPPSSGLTEVLETLGIAEDVQPIDSYDDRVDFRGVVAEYQGTVYRFSLIVSP